MQAINPVVSEAQYLNREFLSPVRHEYVNGQVYALSGGTTRHGGIITNLVMHTAAAAVRRPPCRVFSQGVKVHVAARNSYYYPDVVASCEWNTREEFIVGEPCFIVEVLSPSTASIDRREKRLAYMTLDTLVEYVLVYQDRVRADVYRRTEGSWNLSILREPQQLVDFSCLKCALTLAEIYSRIDLPLRVEEEVDEAEWLMA